MLQFCNDGPDHGSILEIFVITSPPCLINGCPSSGLQLHEVPSMTSWPVTKNYFSLSFRL